MDAGKGNSRIKAAITNIFKTSKARDDKNVKTKRSESPQVNEGNECQDIILEGVVSDAEADLPEDLIPGSLDDEDALDDDREGQNRSPFSHRALPPVPADEQQEDEDEDEDKRQFNDEDVAFGCLEEAERRRKARILDYAASIEKVKDCGWYWGPVSGSAAEKLLSGEPDGSFIVRDSSNENYIFSLTFKLNGSVRHVRIEQDQGNFSFGCLHKFRSNTIVDFVEDAIEHSRSGRYLFFLHRSAVMVPMRVQLLHPVSRFKHIQSLQHLCRFVLLKHVRRDLIPSLPLPSKLKSYLNTPHYYSEDMSSS